MTGSHPTTPSRRAPLDVVIDWIAQRLRMPEPRPIGSSNPEPMILAEPLLARAAIPPVSISSCDGWALTAADTDGASPYAPVTLSMSADGDVGPTPLGGPIARAWRIQAYAALPSGTDAVVSLDTVEEDGDTLAIPEPVAPGLNVIPVGGMAASGQEVFPAGHVIRAIDRPMLFMMGESAAGAGGRQRSWPTASAYGLRVGIVDMHGREPGDAEPFGRRLNLYDWLETARHGMGNSLTARFLQQMLPKDGVAGDIRSGPLPSPRTRPTHTLPGEGDDAADIDWPETLFDVWIGGRGDHPGSHAQARLLSLGGIRFDGVAMNPGDRILVGEVDDVPVILIPDDPVIAAAVLVLVVRPVLRRAPVLAPVSRALVREAALSGSQGLTLRLTRKLISSIGTVDLVAVRLTDDGAEPLGDLRRSGPAGLARSHGYTMVPAESEGWPAGAEITVHAWAATRWPGQQ